MKYELKVADKLLKKLKKITTKDKKQAQIVTKKINQICKNPYRAKPLKKDLKGKRRVHIGHFVLIYKIDESNKTVEILKYKHHDKAYKG